MIQTCAGVAKLVDAPDSKSGGGDTVSVRVRPSVPIYRSYFQSTCKPSSHPFKLINYNCVALIRIRINKQAQIMMANTYNFDKVTSLFVACVLKLKLPKRFL